MRQEIWIELVIFVNNSVCYTRAQKYQKNVTLVIDYFGLIDVYLGDALSPFIMLH